MLLISGISHQPNIGNTSHQQNEQILFSQRNVRFNQQSNVFVPCAMDDISSFGVRSSFKFDQINLRDIITSDGVVFLNDVSNAFILTIFFDHICHRINASKNRSFAMNLTATAILCCVHLNDKNTKHNKNEFQPP
eukprot:462052_1